MTLYKFYADWCGPCKIMKPVVDKLVNEHDLELVEINIDTDHALTHHHEVRTIPTLILMDGDKEVGRQTGALPKRVTEQALGLTA